MNKFMQLGLLITIAVPASAQTAPAPMAPQQIAAADTKANPLDKMICRYEETVGTRLGRHKVCATLREWKDQEEENRMEVDRVQQTTGAPKDPSGG